MKRDYPLFLIDRSRAAKYPNDYIVCLDREVGFVAKVLFFTRDDIFSEFMDNMVAVEDNELAGLAHRLKKGGVVMQVVDFIYHFEVDNATKNRVQVLLKKALKKYMNAEIERTPNDDLGIDNQIKMQQLTLERANQNYAELVARSNGNTDIADHQINLAKETLRTLLRFKEMQAFLSSGFNVNYDPDEQGS